MGSMTTPHVRGLLDELAENGKTLESGQGDAARNAMIEAAGKLILALEGPGETLTRIGWGEPTRNVVIRVALELGLFEKLGEEGEKTLDQMAEGVQADKELISRTLKHLAASGFIQEVSHDVYASNHLHAALTVPVFRDGIIYSFEGMEPCFHGLPTFLAQTAYRDPSDPAHGPSQHGHNTDKPFFEVLAANPRLGTAFNHFMGLYNTVRPHWTSYYPVLERLTPPSPIDPSIPLLVDVGGGLGHDLFTFTTKFPSLPGPLILQDQPSVLSTISPPLPPSITAQPHDFFTPQPIRHARAYFMHLVLHDWPDERAAIILRHIRDAMKPGYSKLLICENVVPDTGAPWQMTSLDWVMMAMLANRERREEQWKALLGGAGLRVVGVWGGEGAGESLVEVVRDDE